MGRKTYSPETKDFVRELRSNGLSYKEIRSQVPIAPSTIQSWTKNIQLSDPQLENLYAKMVLSGKTTGGAVREGWEIKRQLLRNAYKPPMNDPEFMLGLGIYLGEGTKFKPSRVAMSNTDPVILRIYKKWIEKFFAVDFGRWTATVHYHEDKDENDIRAFWVAELGLEERFFNKSVIAKTGRGKKSPHKTMGVMDLTVRGTGTWKIRQKIQKAFDELEKLTNQSASLMSA